MQMITPPWIGLCVIVRRFSMAIEGISSGVEASLAARSRIWDFPSSCCFAGGGGIMFANGYTAMDWALCNIAPVLYDNRGD